MQSDLFTDSTFTNTTDFSAAASNQTPHPERKRKLGLEKFLLAVFLLVASYVVVFSWGVERGRRDVRFEFEAKLSSLESEAADLRVQLEKATAALRGNSANAAFSADLSVEEGAWTASASRGASVPEEKKPAAEGKKKDKAKTANTPSSDLNTAPKQAVTLGSNAPKYTVQLVTYVKKEQAQEKIAHLAKQGYEAFIIPSGKFYQVCIAQLPTKELAKSLKMRVQKESGHYPDAYIRKVAL